MKPILISLLCVTLPICSPFKKPGSPPVIDRSSLSPALGRDLSMPPTQNDKSYLSPTQRNDSSLLEALMGKASPSSGISDVSSLYFEWTGPTSMRVRTRDGKQDQIELRPARRIGDITVDCLFVGYLVKDRGSSVGVLGCYNWPKNSIIIASNYTSGTMFSLINENKTTVELLYTSDIITHTEVKEHQRTKRSEDYEHNTDYEEEELQRTKRSEDYEHNTDYEEEELQRMKRSEYYEDNDDYVDYDAGFDGAEPIPPNVYHEFGLSYDHALFTKMNENKTATEEYIVSVVTLAQTYFKKSTLGTNVHFVINEKIKYLEGKEFKINPREPGEKLNFGEAYKIETSEPLIIFTHTNQDESWRGVSSRREACNATRGRAIIKHREQIQRAALTMAHEMGHLYGNYHDRKEDEKNAKKPLLEQTSCMGQGIMTDNSTNRPEEWSPCSKNRLFKWFTRQGHKCLKTAPPCNNAGWSSPCSCGVDANTNLCTIQEGGYCQHSTATCLVMEAKMKTCRSFSASPGQLLEYGCNQPKDPQNGVFLCLEPGASDGRTCHVVCHPGFTLETSSRKRYIQCQDNQWTGQPSSFKCVPDDKEDAVIKYLAFVMDTSCSFDGSEQDTAWQLANAFIAELIREDIVVPIYQVIGSPGSRPAEVLPPVTVLANFIVQYTHTLTRMLCGAQWNLDAIYHTLEHNAKDGAVIVLYTDTGTDESDKAGVAEKIQKKIADKQATIIIFITPSYYGDPESMMLYRKIAENRVYEMNKHKVKDVIAFEIRNLKKKLQ